MKRLFGILILCLLLPIVSLAQQGPATNYGAFDAAFAAPALSGVGTGTLTYTAGNLYRGGTVKAITAGTITPLDATQNNCDFPALSACDIIFWTSGTGLSKSTSYATAFNGGANIIIAYVTTDGSSNILTIIPSSLTLDNGQSWAFQAGVNCQASATCAAPITAGILRFAQGTAAMAAGTTVAITGIPSGTFSSATSFSCSVSNANGAATKTASADIISATAVTLVASASNSDTWIWFCFGT